MVERVLSALEKLEHAHVTAVSSAGLMGDETKLEWGSRSCVPSSVLQLNNPTNALRDCLTNAAQRAKPALCYADLPGRHWNALDSFD